MHLKTTKWSKSTGNECFENKKDGGLSNRFRNRFTSKTFSGNFLRAVYPSPAQDEFKERKNPMFIIFLGLKDYDGFKGRRRQTLAVTPLFTRVCKLWFKSLARGNPYKRSWCVGG